MVIVVDVEETNLVCSNCNNHGGCTSDTDSSGGGLECGGSVTN